MGRGQSGADDTQAQAVSRRGSMFPRETMIRYHLEHNVYPPMGMGDDGAVEFAIKAIDAVNEGDLDRIVDVCGVGDSEWEGYARRIVEEWKLEHLLEEEGREALASGGF